MDIFEKPIATIEKKHLPCRAIGAYEEWVRGRAGTLRAALLTDGGHRHPEVARFVDEWADILEALHVGRAAAAEVIRLRAIHATVSEEIEKAIENSRRLTEEALEKDRRATEELRAKMSDRA